MIFDTIGGAQTKSQLKEIPGARALFPAAIFPAVSRIQAESAVSQLLEEAPAAAGLAAASVVAIVFLP